MRNLTNILAASCLAGLLAGCAGTAEKAVFQLSAGNDAGQDASRIMFPPPSEEEIPRYVYIGQLVGETNFVVPEQKRDTLGGVFRWLAGLLSGPSRPTVLQRPQAVVVDEANDRILVSDISRQAVFVFDELEGSLSLWEKAAGQQNFVAPLGLALGENGEVYVSDPELGYVARLDRGGNTLGTIGKDILQRPTGVAYDPVLHRLYVSDTRASDIKIFEQDGTLAGTLGEHGEQSGELNRPTFLVLHNGALYVSDTMNARIQVISAETGAPIASIGERGQNIGNLVRPKGVGVDSEDNVYAVESYHDHLLVYNSQGNFLMPIGGGTGQQIGQYYLPSGLWVDSRNRIFLADTFNGRVVVFQFLGGSAENE
ncbi:MAG: hypothetical protein A2Z95_01230 [Gallionellales bacterium GWA2_60_18]|nr:MAG: hypothetical protein A2Z95_01230 [Gallionellales bacterium GWA2_60_18]